MDEYDQKKIRLWSGKITTNQTERPLAKWEDIFATHVTKRKFFL